MQRYATFSHTFVVQRTHVYAIVGYCVEIHVEPYPRKVTRIHPIHTSTNTVAQDNVVHRHYAIMTMHV